VSFHRHSILMHAQPGQLAHWMRTLSSIAQGSVAPLAGETNKASRTQSEVEPQIISLVDLSMHVCWFSLRSSRHDALCVCVCCVYYIEGRAHRLRGHLTAMYNSETDPFRCMPIELDVIRALEFQPSAGHLVQSHCGLYKRNRGVEHTFDYNFLGGRRSRGLWSKVPACTVTPPNPMVTKRYSRYYIPRSQP
jgi:hypothetical protein